MYEQTNQTGTEFISMLAGELTARGGYVRSQNNCIVKREMNATHVVLFALNNGNVRISDEVRPSTTVMYTIIAVFDSSSDARPEIFRTEAEEAARRGIIVEYVAVDLASSTYTAVPGKKISDRAIENILKAVLAQKESGAYTPTRTEKTYARRPLFTEPAIILIVINVLVFAIGYMAELRLGYDPFKYYGTMYPDLVRSGQYWRLFTCMFLHADIVHLAGNMYFLFILMTYMRSSYSRTKFCIVYFLSGLGGSLLSYMFSNAGSLGASGAIMGIGGALVAKMIILRRSENYSFSSYINIAIMIIFNLFYGLFTTGIDNWGHFGGFAVGFLIEVITSLKSKRESKA